MSGYDGRKNDRDRDLVMIAETDPPDDAATMRKWLRRVLGCLVIRADMDRDKIAAARTILEDVRDELAKLGPRAQSSEEAQLTRTELEAIRVDVETRLATLNAGVQ